MEISPTESRATETPRPALTHYLPAFTEIRIAAAGTLEQRAVCDTFVAASAHAVEPTCPLCAEWLDDLARRV